MPRFSLTKQALEDLREIGRYTQERWGREQRRHYLALLDRCFQAGMYLCHRYSGEKLRTIGKLFDVRESAISDWIVSGKLPAHAQSS